MSDHAMSAGAAVLSAAGFEAGSDQPLGVLGQLLDSPAFPDAARGELDRALGAREIISVAQQFSAALRELADATTVVVTVDDLQHVDVESLQCLLHLVRHSRRSRILVLLAQSLGTRLHDPRFTTELLRQPSFERLRLDPLTRDGVAELLSAQRDMPLDPSLADDFHTCSGGNPLLLRALVEDCRSSAPTAGRRAVRTAPSDCFSQAVLTCLHRGGAQMQAVATALAVLADADATGLLSQLARISTVSLTQVREALNAAGITEDHRFRHPATRAAVLDSLSPADRRALHARAAALLHQEGAAAPLVAEHLAAGRDMTASWAVSVLREAAESVLDEDRVQPALAYLELACEGCTDELLRAEIRLRLALITWRVNPAAAEDRHLAEPLAALRAGRLPVNSTGSLAKLLVAGGRLEEARHVLERLKESAGPSAEWVVQTESEIMMPWTWHRQYAESRLAADRQAAPGEPGTPGGNRGRHSPIAATDHFLQMSPLTDATLGPILTAVKSLVYSDRIDLAEQWCELLLAEATRREAPGWQAVFATLRAEFALRQGRLPDAEDYARQAMQAVPERNGNLFIGGAVSALILAYTAMGRYDAAARLVNQSVPDSLFRTVYGLTYLRACGRYYLATNRPHAALSDFLHVGRLAIHWGVDRPVLLPWRTDAAEAWLQLSEYDRAARLIKDQLQMRDADNSRVRGTSLRLQAMTLEAKQRPRTLVKAVEALQRSGDRLELARALSALGETHQLLGETPRAVVVKRRAWQMANECGAAPLCEEAEPGLRDRHTAVAVGVPGSHVFAAAAEAKLSESEKRVAGLAACGFSNRDISEKLFITVSTVEQHLTRIYRKLNISNRQQLPPDLRFSINEIA